METKKNLRKDITRLEKCIATANEVIFSLNCRLNALEEKYDVISGRECAHMLGYKSDSIKSDMLKKKGIEFTLDEKGRQKISRKSALAYLAKTEEEKM